MKHFHGNKIESFQQASKVSFANKCPHFDAIRPNSATWPCHYMQHFGDEKKFEDVCFIQFEEKHIEALRVLRRPRSASYELVMPKKNYKMATNKRLKTVKNGRNKR